MEEKLSYKEFLDRNDSWTMDDRDPCFDTQPAFKPMDVTEPLKMHREDVLSDLLLLPSEMMNVPPLGEYFGASQEVHAPYGVAGVPEKPSHSSANIFDPSTFLAVDSGAASLLNQSQAAPAREMGPPEDFWLGAQHVMEGQGLPFFETPVPNKFPDAAEMHLPGSFVTGLMDLTGELQAPQAKQVAPTALPGGGAGPALAAEELMGFEPAFDSRALPPKGAVSASPDATVKEQAAKAPEPPTPGVGSSPVQEKEDRKLSDGQHMEKEASNQSLHPKAEEVASKPLPSLKGEEKKESPGPQVEPVTTRPLASQQIEESKPSPILCMEKESELPVQKTEHQVASPTQGPKKAEECKAPLGQEVTSTPPSVLKIKEAPVSPSQQTEKESKASPGPVPASREESSFPSQLVEPVPVLERPDENQGHLSPRKPPDRPEEPLQLPPAKSEEHLPELTSQATELKESAPFGEPKPDFKEPLPEKPALAPAAVDKPKEAPEPHPDLPVKLPQEEPASVHPTQVRQANKSSEHRRSGRAKAARLPVIDTPEELLIGLQAQKTQDQEERLVSREESGFISGTSPRSKAPHRKAAGQSFESAEAPRGILLESWDLEALAALKKKKKKPKQKKNQPARAVETWEENREHLRTPLCVPEPRKFEIPLAEPCKNTEEITSVASPEGLWKDKGVGCEPVSAQNFVLAPAKGDQVLQTENSFQLGSEAKTGGFIHVEAASNKSLKSRRKEPSEGFRRHRADQNKQGSPLHSPAQTSPKETSFSGRLEGHPPKIGEMGSSVSKDIEVAPMKSPLFGREAAPESLASSKELMEEKLNHRESAGQRERPGEEAAKSPAEVKTQGAPKGKRCPDKSKGRDPTALEPFLKAATGASPAAEGVSKGSTPAKTENLDPGSAAVPSALELRSETVQPLASVDSTKASFPDVHKGSGSSPLEQPAGAITKVGSDHPKKRVSDSKSKRAKNGSEQRRLPLEDQAPSGTGLPAKSIEVGFSSPKETKRTVPSSEGAGEKRSIEGKSSVGSESSTGCLFAETAEQTGGYKEVADILAGDVTKPLALAAPALMEKPKASKSDWGDFPSSAYPFILAAPGREKECPAPLEGTAQIKEVGMPEKGKEPDHASLESFTVVDLGLPLSTSKPKKRTSDGRSRKAGKSLSEQLFYPEAASENKLPRKSDGPQQVGSANKSPVHPGSPLLQDQQGRSQAELPPTMMEKMEGREKLGLSTAPSHGDSEQPQVAGQKTGHASSANNEQGASSEPLREDTSGVLRTGAPPTGLAETGQKVNKGEDSPSISRGQRKGLDCLGKDAKDEGSVSAVLLVDQASKGVEEGKRKEDRSSVEPSFLLGAKAEAGLSLGAKMNDPAKEDLSDRSRKEARGVGSVFANGKDSVAKPAKRGRDGKSKMAVPVPEQPVQAKATASEGPLPMDAGLGYAGEGMKFVDENRNIKSLPLGHPLLWEENTMHLFGPLALPGAAGQDEAAFRSQGVGCPFLEHAGQAAGEFVKELLFPPEILKDASGSDQKNQHELQDDLAKLQSKEAMIEASLLAKAGDETRAKRNKSKQLLVEQNAPPGKDGAQNGGPRLLDETQGSGFSNLARKEEQKIPAAAQNAGKEGNGSVGQETNYPAECSPPWENKSEAAALQALTEVLVGGNAQLGESKKISKCLQSLGSEAGPDKALEDVPVEEVASACKDPPQHLEQDSVIEPTHNPPVQAAGKEEADRERDIQGLKLEVGQGAEPVLQTVAVPGDSVARKTKKEERAKVPSQLKGYMRPTKSRGIPPPPPPRAAAQENGKRTTKSDAASLHRREKAKPPEIKPAAAEVAMTVNDIAGPPSKELPPSPEKKAKPSTSTPVVKSAAAKTKSVPTTAAPTKRPASATPGQNKKASSPTTGPTAATTTPKRLATSTARPSTLTPKEAKPKGTEGKSLEKRASPSKPSAATPRPGVRSSPATPRPSTALTSTNASSPRSTTGSPPKRPSTIKTDPKSTDAKKTTAKSPSGDPSCLKSTPTSSTAKSSATTPTTASPALPGTAASRSKATAPRLSANTAPDSKKTSTLKVTPKTSPVPKPPRPPTSVSAPDLKNIRSKIGSTDNIKHQPGGGKAKVERKAESAVAARKPELNAVSKMATTKTAVTKEGAPKQPNGKVQIVSKKANYSHVQSKCGSKDNIKHVPGGGNVPNAPRPASGTHSRPSTAPKPGQGCVNVQIMNKKIDLSKVSSKCGSKTNIKHKPGGGDVKIENQKLNFKEKAQAKVGSLDNVGHMPAGGTVKTEGGEEAAPQSGAVTAAPPGSGAMQENGVGPAAPTQGSGDQRGIQCFDTHIQETSL